MVAIAGPCYVYQKGARLGLGASGVWGVRGCGGVNKLSASQETPVDFHKGGHDALLWLPHLTGLELCLATECLMAAGYQLFPPRTLSSRY